jgi:amino acid transporter
MAPSRRSGAFVFGNFDASACGWIPGWAFFVGLLESAYTITGYGMVAATCEEVNNPDHEVPKAMVLSVAAAGITGIFWLVPILFVLPDVQTLLTVATGQPMPLLFKLVTGSAGGGFGLLFLILGVLFFAGVGSLTNCESLYICFCARWSDSIFKTVHLTVSKLMKDGPRSINGTISL